MHHLCWLLEPPLCCLETIFFHFGFGFGVVCVVGKIYLITHSSSSTILGVKVAVRNIRRLAVDMVKKAEKVLCSMLLYTYV